MPPPRVFLGLATMSAAPRAPARWLLSRLPAVARRRIDPARPERLLGLTLLAYGLRHLDAVGALAALRYDEGGRPLLPAPLDCSIAHSGEWAVAAVAEELRVGVDIEAVGDTLAQALPRYFNAAERSWAGSDAHRCHRLWTRKEAVAKGDGGGLPRVPETATHPGHAELDGTAWSLFDFDADERTVGCLAIRRPHAPTVAPRPTLIEADSLSSALTG